MLFLYDFEPLLQKGNATFQDEFDITVITPYCWDFKKYFIDLFYEWHSDLCCLL